MSVEMWGLLGPEFLPATRRTRALGLGASVRNFNELAVPGLGGLWFGKQALLATLGVQVAEQARSRGAKVQNIEVANAIEALACCLAFESNGWSSDVRLRGSTKLQGKAGDLSFARVRQRNFYVTQPMRMATVQALPALGLVEAQSQRFNAFHLAEPGKALAEQACQGFRPYRRSVLEHLTLWVCGQDDRVASEALRAALSPLEPLPGAARTLLRERLIQGGQEPPQDKLRRSSALRWVASLREKGPAAPDWQHCPPAIAADHWRDLSAGAQFFRTRDAALLLLDSLEVHMSNQARGATYALRAGMPQALLPMLQDLQEAAAAFLAVQHEDEGALAFCRACSAPDAAQVLRALVARDGHVLRLEGDEIRPGPAFGRAQAVREDTEDVPARQGDRGLPEGISARMHNLYLLSADLQGVLSDILEAEQP